MANILCMKWGKRYSHEYVNKLYSMVKRNLDRSFRFVCLTDDVTAIDPAIECLALPDIFIPSKYQGFPWRKLSIFTPDLASLQGPVLFLDLDIVITDDISCFFDYAIDKFCIIENWTQKGRKIGNSSVFRFESGKYNYILDYYKENTELVLKNFSNEQVYISHMVKDLNFWPEDFCCSFKRHCVPYGILSIFKATSIPKNNKIVVFHGNPKPPDALIGRSHKILKFLKPSPWIADHWC